MIISLLKGGLGNMMFQIAAGMSLAIDNNTEFAYTLDGWNCVTNYNVSSFPNTVLKNIKQVGKQEISSNFSLYREKEFAYSPISYSPNLLIDGYFQSEKYFIHNKKNIKKAFHIETNMRYKDYTFLHVRRKDYLLHSQVHNVCPISYYEKALEHVKADKAIVLSDDIKWCEKNIKFGNLEFSNSKTDIEDMSIMISCKNSIIANSTFSWWGAWLSNSQTVIAPKTWFGPQGPKYWNDIYANNWIII